MVRTEDSDPLLVTNGADEVMPYMTTDKLAFKAKKDGIPIEVARHNLRTGQVRRNIYHPDGSVEKLWLR